MSRAIEQQLKRQNQFEPTSSPAGAIDANAFLERYEMLRELGQIPLSDAGKPFTFEQFVEIYEQRMQEVAELEQLMSETPGFNR